MRVRPPVAVLQIIPDGVKVVALRDHVNSRPNDIREDQ